MGALAGVLPAVPAASQEASPLRLGTTRTVHLTSALLRDALLGPLIGPSTFCLAMRLEDIPTAIRIGFANDIALDYRIAAVAACLSSSYGDGVNPAGRGIWSTLGSGDGRSLLVPGNGGGPRVPNWAWTDWAPISGPLPDDGSRRPILFLRVTTPAWSYPRCGPTAEGFNDTPAASGRNIVSRICFNTDAATAPGPAVHNAGPWSASPFACVQYRSERRGATVLWGGDSHFAGDTTTASINAFPLQSCLVLSTPERPVSPANYAWGGSPSLVFMPILEHVVEACRPDVAVLQGWTANDGPSEAAATAYAARVDRLAAHCVSLGILPVTVTRFSRETLAGNSAERRVADRLRQEQLVSARPNRPVLDATPLLDDPAHPGAFQPGLSRDGIHPNDAGHGRVAAAFTAMLRGMLARAG